MGWDGEVAQGATDSSDRPRRGRHCNGRTLRARGGISVRIVLRPGAVKQIPAIRSSGERPRASRRNNAKTR